jgi:hypothetical protein
MLALTQRQIGGWVLQKVQISATISHTIGKSSTE